MNIHLTVNGEPRDVPADTTVSELLGILDLANSRVAVEHNRHVVKTDGLAGTTLADGDDLEIVHFVGGG